MYGQKRCFNVTTSTQKQLLAYINTNGDLGEMAQTICKNLIRGFKGQHSLKFLDTNKYRAVLSK